MLCREVDGFHPPPVASLRGRGLHDLELKSVLNQTIQDFEIIVINDGSTDKSSEKVKSFGDSRIRLLNQKNAGVSTAHNRGIGEAKYELIAFLDADDEWLPDYLETILRLRKSYPEAEIGGLQTGFWWVKILICGVELP